MANSQRPRAPSGLKAAGRAVWNTIIDDLERRDGGWELDPRERLTLEAAARQGDMNRALEELLDEQGLMVTGSMGQPRLNAAATELRQGRIALSKLLAELALPGNDGQTMTASQKRATAAAGVRWLRARRGAA